MGFLDVHRNQGALVQLRKIQYATSSFSVNVAQRNGMGLLQFGLLLVSLTLMVVFRYYALERYHYYGCRPDYRHGFPLKCPRSIRPTGIDEDCAFLLFLSLAAAAAALALPVVHDLRTWKTKLSSHIAWNVQSFLAGKGISDPRKRELLVGIILEMEGLHPDSARKLEPVSEGGTLFLRQMASCVWTETYMAVHFRRYCKLGGILAGLTATAALPSVAFHWDTSWHGLMLFSCALLLHVLPLVSSLALLTCFWPVARETYAAPVLATVASCVAFWLLFLTWLYFAEEREEVALARKVYRDCLPADQGFTEGDVAWCLELRGYRTSRARRGPHRQSQLVELLRKLARTV